MRLREAVRSVLDAVPEPSSTVGLEALAVGGLPVAYARLRDETSALAGGDLTDEFGRLFPPVAALPTDHDHEFAGNVVAKGNEARLALAQLGGWLDGVILQARMQLEIDAYARERVKAERGMGFSAT